MLSEVDSSGDGSGDENPIETVTLKVTSKATVTTNLATEELKVMQVTITLVPAELQDQLDNRIIDKMVISIFICMVWQ